MDKNMASLLSSLRCFQWLTTGALLALASGARAQEAPRAGEPGRLAIRVNRPGARISPRFFGMMTEEINHAYDGGLYAELIQNRALQDDATRPVHWSLTQNGGGTGSLTLDMSQPVPGTALTRCLRLDIANAGAGRSVGVANDGYWGVPVQTGVRYRASFWAKASAGATGPLTLALESETGNAVYALARVPKITTEWRKYQATLTAPRSVAPTSQARFVISSAQPGALWLTQVSLFPPTYHRRSRGLRPDLMGLLADLKPTFLRLPGGNYLDPGRYEWKKTIGALDQRAGHPGAWEYRSSDGLGLLEFFRWCEDLHIEALLGVTDGRGWLPNNGDVAPLVQDALDEIEYATGGPETQWGARRIKDGHRAPFALRYVEIGNEDNFDPLPVYNARFAKFYDAIRAKYPGLQIIATRADVTSRRPDVIDDHYYRSAQAMAADAAHYDRYARSGPKIFVGEWASVEGRPTPTMKAALGDAAWLTGLERNSDLVIMEAYAPLLVNVNPGAAQWPTNLIGYDALRAYGSPAYYVQAMFGQNTGDVVLPVEIALPSSPQADVRRGKIGVGTWNTQAEFKDIRVTSAGGETLYADSLASGKSDLQPQGGEWSVQDGALRQAGTGQNLRATVGDATWTDYTLSLRARKTGGREGFLILFHAQGDDDFLWWNVGGWGNTRSAIERERGGRSEIGAPAAVTIETNLWYDVRVEVRGTSVRCYLNDKLVNEATDAAPMTFYAASSRDLKTGDVILKAVNFSPVPQPMQIELEGAAGVASEARATTLSGPLEAVNTVNNPKNVAPRVSTVKGAGRTFRHEFPANSVTVLRVRARK